MKVIKLKDVKSAPVTGAMFTGKIDVKALVDETMTQNVKFNLVDFAPGGRNVFHAHSADQLLFVTSGKGYVATEKEEIEVEPGTAIFFPAEVLSSSSSCSVSTTACSSALISVFTPEMGMGRSATVSWLGRMISACPRAMPEEMGRPFKTLRRVYIAPNQ